MKAAKFMVLYALFLFGAWLAFNDIPDPQEASDAMTIMIVGSLLAIIVYWILRSGVINRPSEWRRGGGDVTKDQEEGEARKVSSDGKYLDHEIEPDNPHPDDFDKLNK